MNIFMYSSAYPLNLILILPIKINDMSSRKLCSGWRFPCAMCQYLKMVMLNVFVAKIKALLPVENMI